MVETLGLTSDVPPTGGAARGPLLSTGERKATAGGRRTDGACRSKGETGKTNGTTGGETVGAEDSSAADKPDKTDAVRGVA
jgi:hypothetical protein